MGLSAEVHKYLIDNSCRTHPALLGIQSATLANAKTAEVAGMCSPVDSASFLQMMVRLTNAKKVVEIGVFTGFTSLAFALALPEDGKVYALDVSEEFANVGKPYWEEAGVASKIDLRIAPAMETLEALAVDENLADKVDIVFIDADKEAYPEYYERALELVRPGGVVLIDNTLRGGRVADPACSEPGVVAIRDLNASIVKDERVDVCMLGLSDGVSIVYKR
jgi:caffeoyl-CoA O-methyltransferase